jgi:hypothetical protein
MSAEKLVVVVLDLEGNAAIDLQNFHGEGCSEVLKKFADGDTPTVVRKKAEYYESVTEKAKVTR